MTKLNEQVTTQTNVTINKLEMKSTLYQKQHIIITVPTYSMILLQVRKDSGHILRQKGKITPALHHLRMDKQFVPMQNKRPVF